jgi:hypothetical protein
LSEHLTCLQSRTLLTSRCGGTGRTPASSSQGSPAAGRQRRASTS